jgi:hypothetical protein
MDIHLNLFAVGSLFLFLVCLFFAVLIIRRTDYKLFLLFALEYIAVGTWGGCAFLLAISRTHDEAFLWMRLGHIGVSFIPVFLFHIIYRLSNSRRKPLLIFVYLQAILFSLLSIFKSPLFMKGVRYVFDAFYYSVPGTLYHVFLAIWLCLVIYSHYKIFLLWRKTETGLKTGQLVYIFIACSLGFIGGAANFLPIYGIDIYPYGNFIIVFYMPIFFYVLTRHRMFDIKAALQRTLIFISIFAVAFIILVSGGYRFYIFKPLVFSALAFLAYLMCVFHVYFFIKKR